MTFGVITAQDLHYLILIDGRAYAVEMTSQNSPFNTNHTCTAFSKSILQCCSITVELSTALHNQQTRFIIQHLAKSLYLEATTIHCISDCGTSSVPVICHLWAVADIWYIKICVVGLVFVVVVLSNSSSSGRLIRC